MALQPLKSESFDKTVLKFREQIVRITSEIKKFINFKSIHPANGSIPGLHSGYGDSDKRFRSDGQFTNKVKDIAHAHLTHNISIVYRIEDGKLYLYGIYTHDDIGTGSTPNINRQNQMATRWSNEKFSSLDPTALTTKEKSVRDEKRGPPQQYDPRTKPTQSPSNPSRSQLLSLADAANREWPQRDLLARINNAVDKNAVTDIIALEVRNLGIIKNSGRSLYPNQQKYLSILQAIAQHLSK